MRGKRVKERSGGGETRERGRDIPEDFLPSTLIIFFVISQPVIIQHQASQPAINTPVIQHPKQSVTIQSASNPVSQHVSQSARQPVSQPRPRTWCSSAITPFSSPFTHPPHTSDLALPISPGTQRGLCLPSLSS